MSSLIRDWDAQIEAADGDEIAAAIGILRCSQAAHQQWADWRADNPQSGSCCPYCGSEYETKDVDASDEFDRRCVEQYEKIISLIARLAGRD